MTLKREATCAYCGKTETGEVGYYSDLVAKRQPEHWPDWRMTHVHYIGWACIPDDVVDPDAIVACSDECLLALDRAHESAVQAFRRAFRREVRKGRKGSR